MWGLGVEVWIASVLRKGGQLRSVRSLGVEVWEVGFRV